MPGLAVKYFVRIVNEVDPDLNRVRPSKDASIEELIAWDQARADTKAQARAEFGAVVFDVTQGFYLCRDGQLTDRVCRGLDFWDADDLGLVEKMVAQLEPPKCGKWVAQVTPFHEDNEVE